MPKVCVQHGYNSGKTWAQVRVVMNKYFVRSLHGGINRVVVPSLSIHECTGFPHPNKSFSPLLNRSLSTLPTGPTKTTTNYLKRNLLRSNII